MDTRTGQARRNLADELKVDLEMVRDHLSNARQLMRALETETKGMNGLPSYLRAKGAEVDIMIEGLADEAEKVARQVMGQPLEPIEESVDYELAEEVEAARQPIAP